MTKKMRCYSKFKHIFNDMYREDDKPWRYLNVPGAPQRLVNPRKVMRRMSLTATGRIVERIEGSQQLAGILGFDDGNIDIYEQETCHETQPHLQQQQHQMLTRSDLSMTSTVATAPQETSPAISYARPSEEQQSPPPSAPWEPSRAFSLNTHYNNSMETLAKHVDRPSPPPPPATDKPTTIDHLRALQERLSQLQQKNDALLIDTVQNGNNNNNNNNNNNSKAPPPPFGWSSKVDPTSGGMYFYRPNNAGGFDTTWDRPTA